MIQNATVPSNEELSSKAQDSEENRNTGTLFSAEGEGSPIFEVTRDT